VKRSFDFCIALLLLIVLLPVLLIIAVMVRLQLGAPIVFRQCRPGLHAKTFELIKFRTMVDRYDISGQPLPDAERLTAFGSLLRTSSLDELPELWNVLKGDMSLVGPRPLLPDYLPLYSAEQARRHQVRPGITGWAQVNGRNSLSWPKRFELDVWYVDNRSFALDLRILFMTLKQLGQSEGINARGHATMPPFSGN
jgi:lipopolysaccharide/colanic/teichoic acid biosynthesis glycosyltransferase